MVNWILVEQFLEFGILVFQKKMFLIFPNENQLGFHMRYRLFLHYGWFLQNLEKDFIPTNMHTNVFHPYESDDSTFNIKGNS